MKFSCPVPKLDYDIITLSHGNGGLLTNRLLNECIFNLLGNEILEKEDDAAILNLNGKVSFSTDSFVVSPIFYPGGDIGDLCINGTVNDVAMCGAIPKYVSLSFIIEEGMSVEELWKVVLSIKEACNKARVKVVTGDTKVVEKGKGDKIFINTTGIGEVIPISNLGIENIKHNDSIIVTGPLASHGITILSEREGLNFDSKIRSDSAPLNHMVEKIINTYKDKIHFYQRCYKGRSCSCIE